ncbi:MAG: hypothetical protein WAQ25_04050 [Candidatus Saccharimonas sp.]
MQAHEHHQPCLPGTEVLSNDELASRKAAAKQLLLAAYDLSNEANKSGLLQAKRKNLRAQAAIVSHQANELIAGMLGIVYDSDEVDLAILSARVQLRKEALIERAVADSQTGVELGHLAHRATTAPTGPETGNGPDWMQRAANDHREYS